MNVRDHLSRESFQGHFSGRTSGRGNRIAISFLRNGLMETEISYETLHGDTARMANFLLGRGLGRGDRVILFLPKSLVSVIAHLACQRIGAITVPLNPGFTRTEMAYLMEDAGAKVVIAGTQQARLIREIDAETTLVEVPTDAPYREVVTVAAGDRLLAPGGGPGDPMGMFHAIPLPVHLRPDISGPADAPLSLGENEGGETFVMAVEFTPSGPRAATMLTYGNASQPGSPHRGDQLHLLVEKKLRPITFTP
jgi:acyl-CoA synthetase (AMP-forming)/AMP-acid ligase II